jgi:hypothetical protein
MLYRIFTERKDVRKIRRICNHWFPAYTMHDAQGSWKGIPEKSLIIEVMGGDMPHARQRVQEAAREIRDANKQECVLVQALTCSGVLI